jgi:hypothetical protein
MEDARTDPKPQTLNLNLEPLSRVYLRVMSCLPERTAAQHACEIE